MLRRIPLVCAAAALLASGCGAPAADTKSDGGAPGQGGTLRYVVAGTPAAASDDPHGGLGNESDALRFAAVYDVLTAQAADGGTEPVLAQSWTHDESLTAWTLHLRENARFTDGKPVRAADVLFSLRRIERKSAENYGRLAAFDTAASSAVDEHTVRLVTRAPLADVPKALESISFVVPEGSEDFGKPVPGSGPYQVVTQDAQTSVLARNNSWWNEAKPHLDRIEIRAVADPQARVAAVTSGQADVAGSVSPVAAKVAESDRRLAVVRRSGAVAYPFVMRLDRAPFDQPGVREAIKLGADRTALVDTVFLGYGTVGGDVPAPVEKGRSADPQRSRDVARARQLLAEAGHPDGLRLTLHTTTSYPGMNTAATLLAEQLKEIGVDVEVRQDPPDTYWTEVYAKQDFYTGYSGGVPFADFARVALVSGSPVNETAWRRPEFDAALAAAQATDDEAKRADELTALRTQVAREGGYLVWGFGDGLDLVSAKVRDLPTGLGFGRLRIAKVWLAP